MTTPPTPMPLGLQYAYTSGACLAFAEAAASLPSCAGCRIVSVESPDGERDHAFVLLEDGDALDAEGRRPLADLLRDFGMPEASAVTTADVAPLPSARSDALRALLLELGWDAALPRQSDGPSATHAFEAAKRDFDRLGGWSGDPVAAIAAATARLRRRAAA